MEQKKKFLWGEGVVGRGDHVEHDFLKSFQMCSQDFILE